MGVLTDVVIADEGEAEAVARGLLRPPSGWSTPWPLTSQSVTRKSRRAPTACHW